RYTTAVRTAGHEPLAGPHVAPPDLHGSRPGDVGPPARPTPDAGEPSAHRHARRAAGDRADPLLVVTDGGEAQPSEPDRGPWVSLRRVAAQSAWRAEGAGRPEPSSRPTRRRRSRPVGPPAHAGNEHGGTP